MSTKCDGKIIEIIDMVSYLTIKSLSQKEQRVLEHRWGMIDGGYKTYEETGKILNLTGERIRQIEVKAIRKLKHPTRCSNLKYLKLVFDYICRINNSSYYTFDYICSLFDDYYYPGFLGLMTSEFDFNDYFYDKKYMLFVNKEYNPNEVFYNYLENEFKLEYSNSEYLNMPANKRNIIRDFFHHNIKIKRNKKEKSYFYGITIFYMDNQFKIKFYEPNNEKEYKTLYKLIDYIKNVRDVIVHSIDSYDLYLGRSISNNEDNLVNNEIIINAPNISQTNDKYKNAKTMYDRIEIDFLNLVRCIDNDFNKVYLLKKYYSKNEYTYDDLLSKYEIQKKKDEERIKRLESSYDECADFDEDFIISVGDEDI